MNRSEIGRFQMDILTLLRLTEKTITVIMNRQIAVGLQLRNKQQIKAQIIL
jgi:IS30 family transposase